MSQNQPQSSKSSISWRRTALFFLGLGLLATIIVGYKSLTPQLTVNPLSAYDKYMHFFAYATLGVLFRLGLSKKPTPLIAISLIAFGGAIEIMQYIMNLGRSASWGDMAANSAGTIVGIGLATLILNRCFTRGSVQE